MYNPNNIKNTVALGIQGENKATVVKFDVTDWIEEFPYANFNILVKRPNETVPYIANTILHDKVLYWVVTQSDTAIKGLGKAELRAIQGDVVKKSITFATSILPSLEGTPTPTPPEPARSWVNSVLEKGNEILKAEARQFYINESGHLIEVDFAGNETDLGNVVGGGSGASTIVKVDGISIMVENIADLHTTGNYSSQNPIANKDYVDNSISEHNEDETAHDDIRQAISIEEQARIDADNNLQTQIDGITSASDVKDVVGTYSDLLDYDTSTLGDNDIVKVLQDETQQDAITYYRWHKQTEIWTFVGSQGPFYTKFETDTEIQNHHDNTKQDEITSTNKLNADLVDDSSATNKFVTAQDKTTWNNKQNAISDLSTIRQNASLGATAVQQNKVKSAYSTTQGDVYDVTYINTMIGDIETALDEIRGVSV